MMHAYHPPPALKAVVDGLNPNLVRVLCDLARLYVCLQWAKQDNEFLDGHPERAVHLVADADVAFNWANPNEERSMMRLFNNELIGTRLSEYVGRWLFVSAQKQLPPTRMFQGHAREVQAKVQAAQLETTDQARAITERILQRDRPFTPMELEEIERFITEAEVETGFTIRSEIEDVHGEVAMSHAARAAKTRLAYLLSSPRVRPMARDWIMETLGGRFIQDDDVVHAYGDWRVALNHAGSATESAVDADAAALAYVDVINESILAQRRSNRVVFLTGSARIFRAGALIRPTRSASSFCLRHPLCFLFAMYSPKGSAAIENNGKEWTAFGNVFESFLGRFVRSVQTQDAVFSAAYYLSWLPSAGVSHEETGATHANKPDGPAWITDELNELQETGVRLVTAQALSLRTEQLVEAQRSLPNPVSGRGPATEMAGAKLTVELDLLHKLRYLETASVDSLLQNLVGGVLSNSLSAPRSPRTPRERWHKVPILLFGEKDTEFQEFAIQLRNDPQPLLSSESLSRVRTSVRLQRSRYLALVLDALVLAAFGEWTAAASMSRRAIERAEYFAEDSKSRRAFDSLGRSEKGQALHNELLVDLRDIDGREAHYMCSHSIRYSAHSLKEFETAARHLRAFRDTADENDRRGRSEDLALSLAEWTFLKYIEGQKPGIGRLNSIRDRLERAHIDLEEEARLAAQADHSKGPAHRAVEQYVWEQTTLNLAVSMLESALLRIPLDQALIRPDMLAETLATWAFKEPHRTSLFARFIAAVTCLHFAPQSAETWCRTRKEDLTTSVAEYANSVPRDGVAYERLRARAYSELVA